LTENFLPSLFFIFNVRIIFVFRNFSARLIDMTITISSKSLINVCLALIILFSGYCGTQFFQLKRTMEKTRSAISKGYGALALETIEPVKMKVLKKTDGCGLLIDTYATAKAPLQLEWASEACIELGKETPEAFLGLASSFEMRGQDGIALQALQLGIQKFERNADLYFHTAQLFKRNKNLAETTKYYVAAIERAPQNPNMVVEALQFFLETNQNQASHAIAKNLRSAEITNPEIKLLIARGLKRGGDEAGAKTLVQEALNLLNSDPNRKAALQEAYKDVMTASASSTTSTPSHSKTRSHKKH
jgi:tetratricopeptide (TPR) repeat protein